MWKLSDSKSNGSFYEVDSVEAIWNSGRDEQPNLGNKIRHKEGYFPVPPTDTQQDIRDEMCLVMEQCGLRVERQHHEVATAGQAEIDLRFNKLTDMADDMLLYKYIVKNVARRHGKTVTFMPKPIFGDNGSGMHSHQSIWKDGKPLFAGKEYAGVSQICLYYIGGILNAQIGDKDKAFEYLETSYQRREWGMNSLLIEPLLEPLRSDPRFQDLVKRVRLE